MSMAKVKGTRPVCVCVCVCVCARVRVCVGGSWIKGLWGDWMRIGLTTAERVHASWGATQRYSYGRVPRYAGRFVVGASPSYRVAHVGVSNIGRLWKNSWLSAQVKTLVLVAWHLAGGFAAQLKYAHIFFTHLYRSSMSGFKPDLVGNVPERPSALVLRNVGVPLPDHSSAFQKTALF